MKNKWRMPHPATMFLLLTIVVVIISWICDIYGLSVHLPQSGEEIRVQNLLNADGVRWMVENVIKNFTGFAPLGLAVIAIFGIGLAQHSGFLDACIRKGVKHRKYENRRVIAWVIILGLLSNLIGDAGYIILLPIAATMFRSVRLNPVGRNCHGLCLRCLRIQCESSAHCHRSDAVYHYGACRNLFSLLGDGCRTDVQLLFLLRFDHRHRSRHLLCDMPMAVARCTGEYGGDTIRRL
jgi:aminobenzoyl-glutamate transport protein